MKTRKTKPSQIFPSREKGVSASTFFQELKINFIALSWEPESLKLEEKEAQGKREWGLAQLVEHWSSNPWNISSSYLRYDKFFYFHPLKSYQD